MPATFTWNFTGSSSSADPTTAAPGVASGADALRDIALDPITKDIYTDGTGDLVFNRGTEAIASDLDSQFKMWLREWYLDRSKGFPWLDVLGHPLDQTEFRRKVEEHVALVPGATGIQNYVLTEQQDQRSFSVEFEVLCDTGEIISASVTVTKAE